ncbi:endolytic transglycosylase MltG [Microbacterium sp. CIAB417]|uniref:endolytic transglycosylase MltG n=1 Tax=Microbacterium sp. CIAB417 TaxID=2860287 RepID=UPI001FAD0052|nr:endolytic transglycosylase MltG [Microbacterium sp. CIAB417]
MSQGDLFDNLPDPSTAHPTVDQTPPAPGSRRAAREAAQRAGAADTASGAERTSEPVGTAPQQATAAGPEQAPEAPVTATLSSPSPEPTVGGSLEDLFAPNAEDHGTEPKRRRRTGCLVALIIVLVLIGGLAAGGVWVWNTYGDRISDAMGWGEPKDYAAGEATGEVFVTIEEGFTGQPISHALYEAGVTKTEDVFYDMLIAEGLNPNFMPGVYRLQERMTAAAALEAIENPENRMEHSVGVVEGTTLKTIVPTIAESLQLPLEDVQAATADPSAYGVEADTLEGWLFPAVYTFDPGVTATQVVQAMVDRTRESLAEVGVPDADAQRILTIASIIQREGLTADFPKVSRVIQNRLQEDNQETHGLLQMDSTAQYGYGLTHDGPVSEWAWKDVVGDQNPWNTYAHPGLPAGPIATASHAAIDAAMNPVDGPWYYFVAVNLDTGETVFSTTYEEQQQAERQYQQWCEDNPDSGCY